MTFTIVSADNKFEGTLFGRVNNLVNLKYFDVRKSSLHFAQPYLTKQFILLINQI